MSANSITVRIKLPWWSNGFVWACAVFARVHGVEPDIGKIAARIAKHIKTEIV